MTLNLVKLCVGVSALEELEEWIVESSRRRLALGEPDEHIHTTRMFPKRVDELLDGGSLYWVIRGNVQVRQRFVDIRPVTGADGVGRCQLVLEPVLRLTQWQPRRAFQGWRYLEAKDAPPDLSAHADAEGLPPDLQVALRDIGVY